MSRVRKMITPLICALLVLTLAGSSFSGFSRQSPEEGNKYKDLFEKFYADGEYEKSIAAGEQLLAVSARPQRQADAEILIKLAGAYRATKDLEKAEGTYKRAIELLEGASDPANQTLGHALERYACFLQRDGNKAMAIAMQRRALSIIAPLPKDFHPGPVMGKVIPGQKISVPQPKYPADAKKNHFGGTASVLVLIDETGKPLTACTQSGDESLAVACEDMAFKARWTPTTLDNVPVRVNGTVVYNFVAK